MRTAPLWLKRLARAGLARLNIDIRPARVHDLSDYLRLFPRSSVNEKAFYNIGSGGFFHPAWTNVDCTTDWYSTEQRKIDVEHDLMSLSQLPIRSGSAEIFYTSHTIEHVKEDAVRFLFEEAHRCLKPGGHFRIVTGPDADLDHAALARNDVDWFSWDGRHDQGFERTQTSPLVLAPLEERWLHHVATMLAPSDGTPAPRKFDATEIRHVLETRGVRGALDFFTSLTEYRYDRPGNHVSWWNVEKTCDLLRDAGFTEPYRSAYGQSRSPVLRNTFYFDRTQPEASLYVEVIR